MPELGAEPGGRLLAVLFEGGCRQRRGPRRQNQAQMARQDIFRFDPNSAGAKAYRDLITELETL